MCKLLWSLKLWWRNKDAYIYRQWNKEKRNPVQLVITHIFWDPYLVCKLHTKQYLTHNLQFCLNNSRSQSGAVIMEEDSGLSPGHLPTDVSAHVNTYYKRWYPKAKEENGCWNVTRLSTGKGWSRTLRSTSFTEHMRQTGSNCSWRGLVKKTGRTIRKLQTIVLGGGGRSRRR